MYLKIKTELNSSTQCIISFWENSLIRSRGNNAAMKRHIIPWLQVLACKWKTALSDCGETVHVHVGKTSEVFTCRLWFMCTSTNRIWQKFCSVCDYGRREEQEVFLWWNNSKYLLLNKRRLWARGWVITLLAHQRHRDVVHVFFPSGNVVEENSEHGVACFWVLWHKGDVRRHWQSRLSGPGTSMDMFKKMISFSFERDDRFEWRYFTILLWWRQEALELNDDFDLVQSQVSVSNFFIITWQNISKPF